MNKKRHYFGIRILIICFCFISTSSLAGMATLSDRYPVRMFIQHMVNQYDFSGPVLVNLFDQVRPRRDILGMMNAPKESSPWYHYDALFITENRIENGVAFWNEHAKTLAYAQKKYGVPASVIVAIIGVETNYGHVLGKYRVIDTLSTLAFDYPARAKFFQNELAQYLLLTREQNLNPLTTLGSYAGAIGVPQFMPSSYRSFAVSFDGGQRIDLINNDDDAIISVANYFQKYGWQSGQPVAVPATLKSNDYENFVSAGFTPKYSLQQLESHGIKPDRAIPSTAKACLLQLEGPQNNQYWLGLNNFYVITQYNSSLNYAMAVYQLGQQIEQRRNQQLKLADGNSKN